MIITCTLCGEHIGTSRIEGLKAWEDADGNVVSREVVVVAHKECYMRLTPDERDALFEQADEDV